MLTTTTTKTTTRCSYGPSRQGPDDELAGLWGLRLRVSARHVSARHACTYTAAVKIIFKKRERRRNKRKKHLKRKKKKVKHKVINESNLHTRAPLGSFYQFGSQLGAVARKEREGGRFWPFFFKEELRRRIKTVSFLAGTHFSPCPLVLNFEGFFFFWKGGDGSQKQLNNVFVCDKTAG